MWWWQKHTPSPPPPRWFNTTYLGIIISIILCQVLKEGKATKVPTIFFSDHGQLYSRISKTYLIIVSGGGWLVDCRQEKKIKKKGKEIGSCLTILNMVCLSAVENISRFFINVHNCVFVHQGVLSWYVLIFIQYQKYLCRCWYSTVRYKVLRYIMYVSRPYIT